MHAKTVKNNVQLHAIAGRAINKLFLLSSNNETTLIQSGDRSGLGSMLMGLKK